MGVPPGPAYIARTLPYLLYPGLTVVGALRLLQEKHIIQDLPLWFQISFVLLAKPLEYAARTYYKRAKNVIEARKLGARVVPHLEEDWPYFGGLSVVLDQLKNFETFYVGMACILQLNLQSI